MTTYPLPSGTIDACVQAAQATAQTQGEERNTMTTALDRLTAERVMGWAVHSRNTAWWVEAKHRDTIVPSGGVKAIVSAWSPSTDIAAAWEVVEHLRKRDKPMLMTMLENDDGEYIVSFALASDRWASRTTGKHKEAALAICLAACGVQDEEVRRAMEENA